MTGPGEGSRRNTDERVDNGTSMDDKEEASSCGDVMRGKRKRLKHETVSDITENDEDSIEEYSVESSWLSRINRVEQLLLMQYVRYYYVLIATDSDDAVTLSELSKHRSI